MTNPFSTEKVKVYDPRTRQYLVNATYPASWTKAEHVASVFERGEIARLTESWPYLDGCTKLPHKEIEVPTLATEREVVPTEVIGWRAWDVLQLGKLYRLGSVTYDAHWPVADWVHAECDGQRFCERSSDGRVPGESCHCGLYAARDLQHLTKELSYADYNDADGKSFRVIGQVAMAGKVIVGTQGWKAERARVFHLYVPHNHWRVGAILAQQYGVPYDTLRWLGQR